MKLIGYVRTSTEEQTISLEAQTEKIKAYCSLYNHELICIYADQRSGKNLDRNGLQNALNSISTADGMIIAKLDRLTRSVKDMGSLLEGHFAAKALVSVQDQIDTSTASGRLVLNVLISVAQWEREVIVERTTAALQHKRSKGERVGHIPFGKKLSGDGHHIEENKEEMQILHDIKTLRANGYTFQEIADNMNSTGKSNRGNTWHHVSVMRAVKR